MKRKAAQWFSRFGRIGITTFLFALVLGLPQMAQAQGTATWQRTYPERTQPACTWIIAQWSDGTYSASAWECDAGQAAVRVDGARATRGYPQLADNGCTEYVSLWSDQSYSWVPFQCPAGIVYTKAQSKGVQPLIGAVAHPPAVAPVQPIAPVVPVIPGLTPPTAVPPPAAAVTFGNGTFIVGKDIGFGTYRAPNAANCYWARLSGLGGTTREIIANENSSGPDIVTIAPTDVAFESSRCGTWTNNLAAITTSTVAPFGPGTFIVGTDIAPGIWRAEGEGCYWARLSAFGGTTRDIIANANPRGVATVMISPGDKGFKSSRCGTWTKIG